MKAAAPWIFYQERILAKKKDLLYFCVPGLTNLSQSEGCGSANRETSRIFKYLDKKGSGRERHCLSYHWSKKYQRNVCSGNKG